MDSAVQSGSGSSGGLNYTTWLLAGTTGGSQSLCVVARRNVSSTNGSVTSVEIGFNQGGSSWATCDGSRFNAATSGFVANPSEAAYNCSLQPMAKFPSLIGYGANSATGRWYGVSSAGYWTSLSSDGHWIISTCAGSNVTNNTAQAGGVQIPPLSKPGAQAVAGVLGECVWAWRNLTLGAGFIAFPLVPLTDSCPNASSPGLTLSPWIGGTPDKPLVRAERIILLFFGPGQHFANRP